MPIFEYLCNGCGKHFEHLLRRTDEKVECPYCGKKDLKRLVSNFSFGTRDATGNFKSSSSKCSSCTSRNCSGCT